MSHRYNVVTCHNIISARSHEVTNVKTDPIICCIFFMAPILTDIILHHARFGTP